jgi:hypothetical protein
MYELRDQLNPTSADQWCISVLTEQRSNRNRDRGKKGSPLFVDSCIADTSNLGEQSSWSNFLAFFHESLCRIKDLLFGDFAPACHRLAHQVVVLFNYITLS